MPKSECCILLVLGHAFSTFFFFSSRRRHTRWNCDWSSDVCSSDLQMRVRIDESRHYNAPTRIDNFFVANILFDLSARTDFLDLAVADKHSSIANDPECRHLSLDARALWSAQRDELRSVQDGQ